MATQEAVLKIHENERYVVMLKEEDVFVDFDDDNPPWVDPCQEPVISIHVIDKESAFEKRQVIFDSGEESVNKAFRRACRLADDRAEKWIKLQSEAEVLAAAPNPYAANPNFGRF